MNDLFEEIAQGCDNVVRYKGKIVCGIVIYRGLVKFVFKEFLIYEVETFYGTALRKRTWKHYAYGTGEVTTIFLDMFLIS